MIKDNEKVGAVVIGWRWNRRYSGLLDLANSGMKVYLVENGISIGGVMTLDKTFPTNDCSACILSQACRSRPSPNVNIMTRRTVRGRGRGPESSKFKLSLPRPPLCQSGQMHRLRRLRKCLPDYGQGCIQRQFKRKKSNIPARFPQAIPSGFAIDKLGTSPCKPIIPPISAFRVMWHSLPMENSRKPSNSSNRTTLFHRLRTCLTTIRARQPVCAARWMNRSTSCI